MGVDGEYRIVVKSVAVVGAGPAGLMVAERLATAGCAVTVYDRMPSPGRKLLMAGRGGLNLTNAAPMPEFMSAYGRHAAEMSSFIEGLPPDELIRWVQGLDIETFVGSSGRVFPRCMKASPLVRAWLVRLDRLGVRLVLRHTWTGFSAPVTPNSAPRLRFSVGETAQPPVTTDAVVLALGGASWPKLGSNGAWAEILAQDGIAVAPLVPANCGISIAWSRHIQDRFAGTPLKRIAITAAGMTARGEAMITGTGLEGGAVYAVSSAVRDAIASHGQCAIALDLRPDEPVDRLAERLSVNRAKQSMATYLRKTLKLAPAAVALLREAGPLPATPEALAHRLKALPLTATGCAGLDRAISTAGGVSFAATDGRLMLIARPGVFVAGEMLDWDAPTGGYLLQATFATATAAADGVLAWLRR